MPPSPTVWPRGGSSWWRCTTGCATSWTGSSTGSTRRSALTPDLRTHCVAFCGAVGRHHTSEDRTAFPALAAQYPELRDTLDGLARDHHVVAGILQSIEAVLTSGDDLVRARSEIDGLAAILESHFRWEERAIVAALDGLPEPDLDAERLFGRDSDLLLRGGLGLGRGAAGGGLLLRGGRRALLGEQLDRPLGRDRLGRASLRRVALVSPSVT